MKEITYLKSSGLAVILAIPYLDLSKRASPIGNIGSMELRSHEPGKYLDGWPSEEIHWLHLYLQNGRQCC